MKIFQQLQMLRLFWQVYPWVKDPANLKEVSYTEQGDESGYACLVIAKGASLSIQVGENEVLSLTNLGGTRLTILLTEVPARCLPMVCGYLSTRVSSEMGYYLYIPNQDLTRVYFEIPLSHIPSLEQLRAKLPRVFTHLRAVEDELLHLISATVMHRLEGWTEEELPGEPEPE